MLSINRYTLIIFNLTGFKELVGQFKWLALI